MRKPCKCVLCEGENRPLAIRVTVTDKYDSVLDTQDYCEECTENYARDDLGSLGLEIGNLNE